MEAEVERESFDSVRESANRERFPLNLMLSPYHLAYLGVAMACKFLFRSLADPANNTTNCVERCIECLSVQIATRVRADELVKFLEQVCEERIGVGDFQRE